MKRFLLLPLLLASVAPAQERLIMHRGHFHETNAVREAQPLLAIGWTVKHVALTESCTIFVLIPPYVDPKAPRKILPGGIEERRLKMQATKVEESKP